MKQLPAAQTPRHRRRPTPRRRLRHVAQRPPLRLEPLPSESRRLTSTRQANLWEPQSKAVGKCRKRAPPRPGRQKTAVPAPRLPSPGKSLPLHLLPVGWPLLPPRFPRDATFHGLPRATPSSPFTPCQKVEGPAVPRRVPPAAPPAVPLSRALHADRRYDVSGVARHLSRGAVRGALTYGPRGAGLKGPTGRSARRSRVPLPRSAAIRGKSRRAPGPKPRGPLPCRTVTTQIEALPVQHSDCTLSYSTSQDTKSQWFPSSRRLPAVNVGPPFTAVVQVATGTPLAGEGVCLLHGSQP